MDWEVPYYIHILLTKFQNWSNEAFDMHRNAPNYQTLQRSWIEQRKYIDYAIESLKIGNNPRYMQFAAHLEAELAQLKPQIPDLKGFIHSTE